MGRPGTQPRTGPDRGPEVAAGRLPIRTSTLLFIVAEVALILAIPFLAIKGYQTLLESRAGTIIAEPSSDDPGWSALVDATPVYGVAEVADGELTGMALIVAGDRSTAGSVILAPSSLVVDGAPVDQLAPEQAVAALGRVVRLNLTDIVVLDEQGWSETLGPTTYVVDNPDPVPGAEGDIELPVGEVEINGATAAAFVGRPIVGAPVYSTLPRRHQFWTAVVDSPPAGDHQLGRHLRETFADRGGQVLELPVAVDSASARSAFLLDGAAAEQLIRTTVPFPAGFDGSDRLTLRLIDRAGGRPISDIAAELAGHGIEVVQIGRALQFDEGPTEIIIDPDLAAADSGASHQLDDLATSLDIEPLVDIEAEPGSPATLLVGADFSLDRVNVDALAATDDSQAGERSPGG